MDELRLAVSTVPGRRHGSGVVLSLALCSWLVACAASPPAGTLARTFETKEALARAVLDGFARRDAEGLRALALDEHEFRRVVWPELPSGRPETNIPVEYAWGTLRQNSRGSLATLLDEHGGQRYDLVDVQFAGETTRAGPLTIHRKAVLTVRDGEARERRLRLFGSAVVLDGRWKLFSYVVD